MNRPRLGTSWATPLSWNRSGAVGQASGNEIYGITSRQLSTVRPITAGSMTETHENFMRVWRWPATARTPPRNGRWPWGFVAHNGVWGADYIAHVSSLTIGDPAHGYVIARWPGSSRSTRGSGFGRACTRWGGLSAARFELCHNIVEYAIDIAVWQMDPGIASRSPRRHGTVDAARGATAYARGFLPQQTEAPLNQPAAMALLQSQDSSRSGTGSSCTPASSRRRRRSNRPWGSLWTATWPLAVQQIRLQLQPGQAAQLLASCSRPTSSTTSATRPVVMSATSGRPPIASSHGAGPSSGRGVVRSVRPALLIVSIRVSERVKPTFYPKMGKR